MNLGGIKKCFRIPSVFGRYFLALVFLSAGFFRIFSPETALEELLALGLPLFLSKFIIIFEITAGLLLIFNKWVRYVYLSLLIFLSLALLWSLIIASSEILSSLGELFVFNLTPTDWFLHFIFLVVAVFLIKDKKDDNLK